MMPTIEMCTCLFANGTIRPFHDSPYRLSAQDWLGWGGWLNPAYASHKAKRILGRRTKSRFCNPETDKVIRPPPLVSLSEDMVGPFSGHLLLSFFCLSFSSHSFELSCANVAEPAAARS